MRGGEELGEHRLREGSQRQAVGGADQVDGAAHEHEPDHVAFHEQAGELLRLEAVQA